MLKLQIKIKLRYAYSVKRNVCHNYFRDVVFNITIVLRTVKLKHIIFYLHELAWDLIRPELKRVSLEKFRN